jgi:hypothetical protein
VYMVLGVAGGVCTLYLVLGVAGGGVLFHTVHKLGPGLGKENPKNNKTIKYGNKSFCLLAGQV